MPRYLIIFIAMITLLAGCDLFKKTKKSTCENETYQIKGNLSGLNKNHYSNTIIVNTINNKSNILTKNGNFTFSPNGESCLESGYQYSFSIYEFAGGIKGQPYICEINNYQGTIENQDITNVKIICNINPEFEVSTQNDDITQQCRTFNNPSIYPSFTPSFSCGPSGYNSQSMINDINQFWGANMYICSCLGDAPYCESNAVVYGNTPTQRDFAYIFYDPNLLERMLFLSNTFLSPAWLISHEAGHVIQAAYSISYPATVSKELSADCFSGYFLGHLICAGKTDLNAINSTLTTLCTIDNGQSAFLDPSGHGSCIERVNSIKFGINSYLNDVLPLDACL